MASPTIIGGSSTGALTGGSLVTQDTFNITVAATGQNTTFFGYLNNTTGGVVTSATLGGQNMTVVTFTVAQMYISWMYINTSVSGTGTKSWVINFAGTGVNRGYIGFTAQDVDQTTQIDSGVTINQNNSLQTSASKAVTTGADNELVISSLGLTNPSSSAIVNTWSATDFYNSTIGQGPAAFAMSYLEKTTAGSITPSYTWTTTSSYEMSVIALRYQAPASVGTVPVSTLAFMGVG